ncbi:MAG: S8 family serine peptidase, partial [Nanoarchaeota archaeon]
HVYVAKVLDAYGCGNEGSVALGIDWALEKDVRLMNMSLGSRSPSPLERELMNAAHRKNIIVCAAAGNEGRGPSYPAAFEHVLSVAAVDRHNEHAAFSNIDPSVDISAPGVAIVSCVPGNGYAQHSGTSMATPLACGVGALVAATGCSALELALQTGAQQLGPHDTFGAGLVRADNSVGALHKQYNRGMAVPGHGHRWHER